MTDQTKTNNLNYLIDPTLNKVNRLFVFNVLINGKSFFDIPIKKKEEAYEKIIEMSKNNDYPTDNLLDYEHFQRITN